MKMYLLAPTPPRDEQDLPDVSGVVSAGFWSTVCPSVLPNITLPHLNSLLMPLSQSTSTELVSSITLMSDTSKTPALTRILILAICGSARRSCRIFCCLFARFTAATSYLVPLVHDVRNTRVKSYALDCAECTEAVPLPCESPLEHDAHWVLQMYQLYLQPWSSSDRHQCFHRDQTQ